MPHADPFEEVIAMARSPLDVQNEREVLGGIFVGQALPEEPVCASDFSVDRHRHVYQAMCAVAAEGKPVDYLGVADELERRRLLESCDGPAFLVSLSDGLFASAERLRVSCDRLTEAAARRRALKIAYDLALSVAARVPMAEVAQRFSEAATGILGDSRAGSRNGLGADELEAATREYALSLDANRSPTGIGPLDDAIGGVARGQVLTILARTGVGKSAIAQNMVAAFLRRKTESSAVFCSAEMPSPEFWMRQRQIETGVTEGQVIRAYRGGDIDRLSPGFMDRARKRIQVIPWARMKLSEVESGVERAVAKGSIFAPQLVVLDYIGLFSAEKYTRSDVELYGEIAKGAKVLAKNMNVALILIAQSSRSGGDGSQPVTMVDARNSGEIEEACDFLVGAWRPELKTGDPRRMTMGLLKARRCALREFDVIFDAPTLRVIENAPEAPRPGSWAQ